MSLSEPLRPSRSERRKDDVESGESESYHSLPGDGGNNGKSSSSFFLSGPSSSSSASSPERQLKLLKLALAIVSVLAVLFLIITVALALRGPKEEEVVVTPVSYDSSSSSSSSSSTGSDGGAPYLPPVQVDSRVLQRLADELDSSRDLSADPCHDWYRYACGGWMANTTIPPGATQVSKGFGEAAAGNALYIEQILSEDWPILQPLYDSCMDLPAIERASYSPINATLRSLDPRVPVNSVEQLYYVMGGLRRDLRVPLTLQLQVRANPANPRAAISYLSVGGTTISGNNAWTSYIGRSNVTHRLTAAISAMLQLVGDGREEADQWARDIVAFETQLINITQRTAIAAAANNRSGGGTGGYGPERVIPAFSLQDLEQLAPHVPFASFMQGSDLAAVLDQYGLPYSFYLQDNASFPLLDAVIASTPLSTLQAYAYWHVVNASTPYLSLSFQQEYYRHFSDLVHELPFSTPLPLLPAALSAPPPRHSFCANLVSTTLPDLFGRYFVQRRLPEQTRAVARDLITWIRQAFERNLPSISWMDADTRAVALDKAYAVLELVGGPEAGNWSDYTVLQLRRDRLADNVFQVLRLRTAEDWLQLTRPVSRYTFSMNPSIVNAQYSPLANAMIFPAGILQRPFFDFDYPMAVNLGRIGMVMGHELLHGFDNSGRQFDRDGYRRQWWNDSIIAAFTAKSQCLIDQYDNIEIQGSRVNGRFTLGENIADNGGLHMAFLALQWYTAQLAERGLSDPVPPAASQPLNSEQLFYWGYSQTWCTKATDAAIARQVVTDVHSPGEVRVWAPLVNQEGFARAFNCPVGSRMNPESKCDLY